MREKEIDFDLIYDKLETMKVEDKTRIICEDISTENSQIMREEMLPFIQTYFNKLKTKSILTSNFSDDFLNLFDIVVFNKNSKIKQSELPAQIGFIILNHYHFISEYKGNMFLFFDRKFKLLKQVFERKFIFI